VTTGIPFSTCIEIAKSGKYFAVDYNVKKEPISRFLRHRIVKTINKVTILGLGT
jgi:hypothetical protein